MYQLINILPEFQQQYTQHNADGYHIANNSSVAIVGLCRNLENCLSKNLSIVEKIGLGFNNYNFFLYENDSEDNTVNILHDWHNQDPNKHNFLSEKLNVPKFNQSTTAQRIETMAYGRNVCLNYVKEHMSNFDWVWVVDLDFLNISEQGIFNSISWLNKINHAYGIAGFSYHTRIQPLPEGLYTSQPMLTNYDSWAYRHTNWTDTYSLGMLYWFWWWIPLVGSPPFSVNSAFGGSCIYKTSSYVLGKYSNQDCEHVTFHYDIHTKTKQILVVNPSQIMLV